MILGPFEFFFHEGTLWTGYRTVIYFILTKQVFLHLFCHGDSYYNRYTNTTDNLKYLDDDGSGVKPRHFLQRGMKWKSFGEPLQAMWNRDRKITRYNFYKKENQLDLFILLDQNSVKLKVICWWGHVYKMLLLILPLGLENVLTNRNCIDSDLLEKWKIQIYLR